MGSKALETASTKLALLFLLLNLSICFNDAKSCGGFRKRIHIHMTNDIDSVAPNTTLFVHCQSKSRDVGIQNLSLGQEYIWDFCPDIFGRTKYWCYLEWTDVTFLKIVSTFDIFKDHAKVRGCRKECFWAARNEGIYRDGIKIYGWFRGNATELSM